MKRIRTSASGFLRLAFIRLLLPIGFFWGGGQALYTALTNRGPLSTTFAEYVRTHPDKKWVELKETRLDVLGSISSGTLGSVSEIYIPMHAPAEPDGAKVSALLHTRDSQMLDLVKQLKAQPNEKAVVEFVMKNRERVFPQRTVNGLVQFGLDSASSKKRGKIAKLDANLIEDFAVIEDGKKPNLMMGIILFVVAFPVAWLCWLWRPGSSRSASSPPSVPR